MQCVSDHGVDSASGLCELRYANGYTLHVNSSKSLTATEAALQLCTYIAALQGARDCTAEPRAWPKIRCAISAAVLF